MIKYEDLAAVEKRFLEIKPDYNLGLYGCGEGRALYDLTVDEGGRVTLTIEESYLRANYSMGTRWLYRHPKLAKEQIAYILYGKVNS